LQLGQQLDESCSAAMLPALRNLDTAKAEGLLDALEYDEAK